MHALNGASTARFAGVIGVAIVLCLSAACGSADKPQGRSSVPTPAATEPADASSIPSSTAAPSDTASAVDAVIGAIGAAEPTATPLASVPGGDIYIVPLEDFPVAVAEQMRDYFANKYRYSVVVTAPIAMNDDVIDYDRGQLVSERVVAGLAASLPSDIGDGVVIGLTQYDIMMDGKPEWNFVFSYRDIGASIGIVSTARMDPVAFGEPANDDLMFARASKMVAKHIGVMYLQLPPSDDPTSVMYGSIGGLEELDRIVEDLNQRGR